MAYYRPFNRNYQPVAPKGSVNIYSVETMTGWDFEVYVTPDDVCIAVPADDLCEEALACGQDTNGLYLWEEGYGEG